MSSPACAPDRRSAWPTGRSPNTVMQMVSGPCVVSPPTSSQPASSASANRPSEKPCRKGSSTRGSASASVKASGLAPQAARSLRLTASALWPSLCGATVGRKWRPSTSMSLDTAHCMPGAGASSAQSSPMPSSARFTGRVKYLAIRSNSPRGMAGDCHLSASATRQLSTSLPIQRAARHPITARGAGWPARPRT